MSELKIIERLVDDLVTRVEALEEKSEEIWVPVKDNCNYFISNKGRVKHYQGRESKIGLHEHSGYNQVWLNGKNHLLHRLLAQAFIPNPENKPQVDHIDLNRKNNSLVNLRWCSHAENMMNRRKFSNNTSEYRGVTFHKSSGKYHARIQKNGKRIQLGAFETLEEASTVYEAAAKELYGEFYCER